MRKLPTPFVQLLLLAAMTVPAAARAEGPKVYVAPYAPVHGGVTTDLGVKTAGLIATELKGTGKVTVVDGPSLQLGSAPTPDAADEQKRKRALNRAEKLSSQGDAEMRKLAFDSATTKYGASLKLLEQNVDHLEDFDRINYVRLSLATAMFRTGKEDEGERVLADVIRLDPDRTLDASLYPPVFVRTYDAIRVKLLKLTRGAMSVTSEPAGAEVFLDGRSIGKTPILVKDLIRGEHYVRVLAEGAAPWARKVEITPTKVERVEVDLGGRLEGPVGGLVESLADNELDAAALKRVGAVQGTVGVDYVVFGAMTRGEDVYRVKSFLYSAATKKIAALSDVAFDFDMLGAAIEVYKLAGEVVEGTSEMPDAVDLPQTLFTESKAAAVEIAEVSVAPAATEVKASTAPSTGGTTGGPIAPSSGSGGPLQPSGGPTSTGGPVTARSGPITGPVSPATTSGGPLMPATGGSGPLQPKDPEETVVEPVRERQVKSLFEGSGERPTVTETQDGGPKYSAVDVEEIVIPKDEIEEKKGWPWWAWGLLIVGAGAAVGGGTYYAYDQGAFTGAADDATVTFRW